MFLFRKKHTLQAALRSHPGLIRGNNEDAARILSGGRTDAGADLGKCSPEQAEFSGTWSGDSVCFLAAAADGMGGEACGELASFAAIRHLQPASFRKIRETGEETVRRANEEICREMAARGARMGSTLAVLYLDGDQGMAMNLGDSRIYLLRDGSLTQLSEDHSRAAQMVRQGILTPEEALSHPGRHALTQHLGIEPEEFLIEPAWEGPLDLAAGDRFLLCSDGLYDMVSEEEIRRFLETAESPEDACGTLLDAALAGGGRDNVTVLAVFVS